MSDTSDQSAAETPFLQDPLTRRWLTSSAILALGLVVGGYLLGNGLLRAHAAERSVTVRGLAERDVTADLATWTLSYSSTAADLATAQAGVDRDTQSIRQFFEDLGFPADAIQPSAVNVTQFTTDGVPSKAMLYDQGQRKAQAAVKRQFELVRKGVVLEEGSGMAYTFTKLNDIKPEMVADATKDARAAAEQFADDSGTSVGGIKSATQGYFEINARDGDSGGGWGQTDTPFKKVRVVTTIDFYLR